MSKNKYQKPTQRMTADDRRRRRTQVVFAIFSIIIIISWIASMIAVL